MAGQPKTRAKKKVAQERRAERAANEGKRITRNPTPPEKREAKKAAAEAAKELGIELEYGGHSQEAWMDFCHEFMRTGRQDKACKKSGIPRQTVYKRTRNDVEFEKFVAEVKDMLMDSLEDEAIRRGRDGWNEPQFFKGEFQGNVRKFDSGLLQFMLIHGRPEKYRPKKEQELTLKPGAAGNAPIINLTLNRPKGK
jgi:hypothetical protein